jgi:hypothetical protein
LAAMAGSMSFKSFSSWLDAVMGVGLSYVFIKVVNILTINECIVATLVLSCNTVKPQHHLNDS